MLFQSSKLKAWASLLLHFSEKSHSSFALWALKELSKMSPHVGLAVPWIKGLRSLLSISIRLWVLGFTFTSFALLFWKETYSLSTTYLTEQYRENGRNVTSVWDGLRSAMTRSRGLESAMVRVDRPRTSADERVLSGRRAAVMCDGLLRGSVILRWPFVSRERPHCAVSG